METRIRDIVSDAYGRGEIPPPDRNSYYSLHRYLNQYAERFFSWMKYSSPERILYLKNMLAYADQYGQPMGYVYADEDIVCIKLPEYSYAIPKNMIEIQPFKDYSDTPVARIGICGGISSMLPALNDEVTENSLKAGLEEQKKRLADAVESIKAKEEEQKQEIERIKQEIEAKYAGVFALLEQQKKELEIKKEKMEQQLYVLDAQIYGIRCFFGETVQFTKLTEGLDAPDDCPVVLHQKIRFLDEELAKYVALYDFDGEDTSLFEKLLQSREDMRNLFFPGDKSVSLVRISKDGKIYQSEQCETSSKGTVYSYNILKSYQSYHGKQLAVLVRNGGNCYIGWTDEDRICLSDDNVFLTPKSETVVSEQEERKLERTSKEEFVSRYYIFSILQGLILNSRLIRLPEGEDILHGNSPYVVFSMADAWIRDTRYGTFSDILYKYNGLIRKGDMLLTLRSLSAEGDKYSSYSNDRGVGYRNRTHDVYASTNTLYPANLVENKPARIFRFEWRFRHDCIHTSSEAPKWSEWRWETIYSQPDAKWEDEKERYCSSEFRNLEIRDSYQQKVYISLEKDENWMTGTVSRANFELMSYEYINLTFLNSVLIRYVIMNRDLGAVFRQVNFSYMIPYLNHALEYLLSREKTESKLISRYMDLPNEWQMALSEWKMAQDVHVITDYQAKRFVKWYKEQ